jgi:hypothetical protein
VSSAPPEDRNPPLSTPPTPDVRPPDAEAPPEDVVAPLLFVTPPAPEL